MSLYANIHYTKSAYEQIQINILWHEPTVKKQSAQSTYGQICVHANLAKSYPKAILYKNGLRPIT